MIKKFIVSVIVLVLVTVGTASAEWYKQYGGNEFDGKNEPNFVSAESKSWMLEITKWEDGTIQSELSKYRPVGPDGLIPSFYRSPVFECTPDFQVLVDGVRRDASFIVSRVDGNTFHFAFGKAIMCTVPSTYEKNDLL